MDQSGTLAGGLENVIFGRGPCVVTLAPAFGGKIASIRFHGRELLQEPLLPMAPRTRSMGFDEADASGWDECLPSVAACSVPLADGSQAAIPDHGDLWRIPWQVVAEGDRAAGHPTDASYVEGQPADSVTLRTACFSLPLRLERQLRLSETATGCRLNLAYRLWNEGTSPVPWSWSAHPLFAAEPGDRIVLPDSVHTLRLEGSGGGRLGKGGDSVNWPGARLSDGGVTDLSLAQPPASAIGDKLFAGPLAAHENWCALERPSAGVRIRVQFDVAATPYLGLWICYGGWPERPGNKQVCVALEPCTAPVDSLAVRGPWSRTLEPGQSVSWPMFVDLESIE